MILGTTFDICICWIVGLGPLIKVVEEFTQRKATVVGKPGVALRDVIIAKFNITDPKRILFVGDM